MTPRAWAVAALAVLAGVGIWTRLECIAIYGGLEPSYVDWARLHYFGGITAYYLDGTAAIEALRTFPTLGFPPGYPVILAAFRVLGFDDLQQLRGAQAALEAVIGVPAMYRVARISGVARPWAVLGGGGYAVYTPLAVGAGLVLAETLTPALLLLTFCATAWAARRPSWLRLFALGVWLGVTSLIRPELILLGGPLALWLFTAGRVPRHPAFAAVLAGGFVVALLPWGIHNRVVHRAWVFTSTGGSAGLWEGLGAIENPYGYVLNDAYTLKMLEERGMAWHSVEADRFLKQDYYRAWRDHPAFVLQVAAYRWRHILWSSERFRTRAFLDLQSWFDRYGLLVCGGALLLAYRQSGIWLAVVLPVTYALLSIGMVHYEARYVRYVHVAYAIAALIALTRLTAIAPARLRMAIVVVVLGVAAQQAWAELRWVHGDADAVRLLTAATRSPGSMIELTATADAAWTPNPTVQVATVQDGLHVVAPPLTYDYLLTRSYEVPGHDVVLLRYDLTITMGAVTVGLLSAAGEWIHTVNLLEPGHHAGSFAAPVRGGPTVTAVVAAANAAPAASDVRVHAIRIAVDAEAVR